MEGGDTGVHAAMRQAWAEASYWLSGMSVAVAAPSYSGDPEEEEAEPGWVRGAGWVEAPRKNWAPSPLDIPGGWAPGGTVLLLADHRLGYWLQWKRQASQRPGAGGGEPDAKHLLLRTGGHGSFRPVVSRVRPRSEVRGSLSHPSTSGLTAHRHGPWLPAEECWLCYQRRAARHPGSGRGVPEGLKQTLLGSLQRSQDGHHTL